MLASTEMQRVSWRYFTFQMVWIKRLKYLCLGSPSTALKCSFYLSIGCLNGGKQHGKHAGQSQSLLVLKKRGSVLHEFSVSHIGDLNPAEVTSSALRSVIGLQILYLFIILRPAALTVYFWINWTCIIWQNATNLKNKSNFYCWA